MSLFFYPSTFHDWKVSDPRATQKVAQDEKENAICNQLAPLMSTDLSETESTFEFHADLPGVEANDIDITILEGNTLQVRAERKYVQKMEGLRVHSTERSYGMVQRKFKFLGTGDLQNAQVTFVNGILNISIPKVVPAETTKKLKISTSA